VEATPWDWWTGSSYNDIDFAEPGPDGEYAAFTGGVWGTKGGSRVLASGAGGAATDKGRLPLTFCSANSALYNEKWNSRPMGGGMGCEEAAKVKQH
jgi:hypothetical protein